MVPKDGLRTRLYLVRGTMCFQMALDRDGFSPHPGIRFNERLSRITFTLENRSHDEHQTIPELRGLLSGTYHVWIDRQAIPKWWCTTASRETSSLRLVWLAAAW
jgi:hypothetical protein